MKNFLIIFLTTIATVVHADPSNPKAQRGNITFLSSEMWTDASSSMKKYPVRNIADNNPLTAWVFEPEASSQKEVIGMAMQFSEPYELDGISIINGYAKSEALYKANNSIESFELILSTGEKIEFSCQETMQTQTFNFDKQKLDWIILIVKKIRKGTKYNDLCISELTATLNGASILTDSDDIILSNSGGEYESDKVYDLSNTLKLDTKELDFGCGSQDGAYNPSLKLLAYSDGCNDYGNAVFLNLKTLKKQSFEKGIWADHWVVGIKSQTELIISDGDSNFIFNTSTKKKSTEPIGKTKEKESLWNWTRKLDKLMK